MERPQITCQLDAGAIYDNFFFKKNEFKFYCVKILVVILYEVHELDESWFHKFHVSPGEWEVLGSILGCDIPKLLKMVLAALRLALRFTG